MMRLLNKWLLIIVMFITYSTQAQNATNDIVLTSGFNRIGFFNDAAFRFNIKQHQVKLGGRHYTLDNFFEKNTIGFSLDYSYKITSNKLYFYPGMSTSFFVENKTNARVFISDYKLINGVGINLNSKWSIFYQLGFGIISTKSYLFSNKDIINVSYFNYEMAFGVSYQVWTKCEKRYLKE